MFADRQAVCLALSRTTSRTWQTSRIGSPEDRSYESPYSCGEPTRAALVYLTCMEYMVGAAIAGTGITSCAVVMVAMRGFDMLSPRRRRHQIRIKNSNGPPHLTLDAYD